MKCPNCNWSMTVAQIEPMGIIDRVSWVHVRRGKRPKCNRMSADSFQGESSGYPSHVIDEFNKRMMERKNV